MRMEIPLYDIVAHQNFLNIRKQNINERIAASKCTTSCSNETKSYPNPFSVVPRSCPFAWLRFEIPNDSRYLHRKEGTLTLPSQPRGNLVFPSSAIEDYYNTLELLLSGETVSSSSIGDDRTGITVQEEHKNLWKNNTSSSELPKMIFLGRKEAYKFTLYLYLDYDSPVGKKYFMCL